MKYPEELLTQMEDYSVRLGINGKLVHKARTTEQADTLKQIQFECEGIHRPFYQNCRDHDTPDPYREQIKGQKAITTLIQNLQDYHMPSELEMIVQLQALQKRLNIDNRVLKPKQYLDVVLSNIVADLEAVGFSDNNTKTHLIPIFKTMIKGTWE